MNICTNGNGECFEQISLSKYRKNPGSECECRLHKCYVCNNKLPRWILDCHEGFCVNCGIYIYSLFMELNNGLDIDLTRDDHLDFCKLIKKIHKRNSKSQ